MTEYRKLLARIKAAEQRALEKYVAEACLTLPREQRRLRARSILDEELRSRHQTLSADTRIAAVSNLLKENGHSTFYARSLVELLYSNQRQEAARFVDSESP